MKRFIISVLFVSVFCIGLGALVDKAGAKFKSDEKALALIQQARMAIGGNAAIANVQSMRIVGQTTRNFKVDGVDRAEKGETEIAIQLPDKIMRMVKIGDGGAGMGSNKMIEKQVEVVVDAKDSNGKEVTVISDGGDRPGVENNITKILVKKADGTVEEINGADADAEGISIRKIDGENGGIMLQKVDGANGVWTSDSGKTTVLDGDHKVFFRSGEAHDSMRHNELLRLTLGLLLTAPQGLDVNYTFGGIKSVDGTSCNLIIAETGGTAFKIYLGQTSNLPVMMTYTGMKMPAVMKFHSDAKATGSYRQRHGLCSQGRRRPG